jgi:Phospholipid methyltransferase
VPTYVYHTKPVLFIDDVNRYKSALEEQPVHPLLQTEVVKFAAIMLFSTGNILVLSSMWALGVTGTYLGKVIFKGVVLARFERH